MSNDLNIIDLIRNNNHINPAAAAASSYRRGAFSFKLLTGW